jgi:methylthioribose-1-phosphate isomerase
MKYAIEFKHETLRVVDQTLLPARYKEIEIKTLAAAWNAIKTLKVRGAPLIGVFAAYSVWVGIRNVNTASHESLRKKIDSVIDYLRTSRPTAVNLFWALERVRETVKTSKITSVPSLKKLVLDEAKRIDAEDKELCRLMGEHGVKLFKPGDRILTHCNTGFLATAGDGTALSVIYEAARRYKKVKVYSDETRPLLQGSRLTVWELMRRKVDVTQICDNTAGYLMQKGMIDRAIVGADRITANGGVANKIGTYTVAVLCYTHGIPFYVAAPSTTFDLKIEDISQIPIEERSSDEVCSVFGARIAPEGANALNYAFDTTPPELITAIITEKGVIRPPYKKNIAKIIGK